MAVTSLLSDSSVESVKQAVRSTSTCSNATVISLQTLFRGLSKTSPESDKTTVKRGTRTTKTTATSTRPKSSRGTKVSAHEAAINTVVEMDAARLSFQEKLVLATDVFNTTLKTLSDASKLPAKRDEARARTACSSPSPSRGAKSPRKLKTSQEDELDTGLAAVAECASMALSSLRSLKGEQSGQQDGFPNMQLEQGACVLAGRYLSLGLNDMASKELRGLKRRLQQYLDSQATMRSKTTSRRKNEVQEEESAKERMSDLLTFANFDHAGPVLSVLVPFQSNTLRLIASEKKLATVQKVASSLQLSELSSPANVIVAATESGALTTDKAALQLQLLSNTVLSLAGVQQPSNRLTTRDRLKPSTSLSLQLLSLEIRCMSWKLSGHTCDEGKEMWDPLTRYLANYSHHSKGIEKAEFASIYKTIIRLQTAVANTQKRTTASLRDNVSVARIATILGHLAQEAGCFDEALKLFTEAVNPLSSGQCLSLATVRCKIATLHLQANKSSKPSLNKVTNVVSDATSSLSMPLKGSLSDLDELLVEAAKLKKLTMSAYGDLVTKAGEKNGIDISQIYEYLPAFLRFLRRYVGRPSSSDNEPKEDDLFLTRVRACRNIVLSAVDSALAVGKFSIMSQRPPWEDVLSALTDCQRLLTAIDVVDEEADPSVLDQIGAAFVRLSNLFWSRYLKEKERGKGYSELVPLVKHSAHLLSSCSPEQRITGFAALKYERLAYLYMEGNRGAEAEQAFSQAIQEHIDTGVLDGLVSSPNFPHRTCQDPKSNGFMLGRVLTAYLKLQLRLRGKSKSTGFFDDESQSLLVRGHIMEWQMGILAELHSHASSDEAFRSHFTCLVSKLLGLYDPEIYPIRRLRVVLGGLRSSLERPNCLESTVLHKLHEEGLEAIEAGDYAKMGDLQPETLNLMISSWTSLMRNCNNGVTLIQYVGDVEHYLLQLKAIVDYTEIHGLWKLQLSTLELVLRVTELQEGGDFSEAIIVIARLVQQYCRLGYCKKAGDLLTRAEQYLGPNVSCLATLSHKLARVAFLIEIGETEKAAATLSAARSLYESNQKKQDLNGCSVLAKIAWERLVADAAFMSSQLSFAQGVIKDALFFAKLSVRLNCRIWAKVEKISQRKQEKSLPVPVISVGDSSELDNVVETMAKLDVSQANHTTTSVYTQGAPFWPHIGSHHTSLLNLASLSAHHGLFQDAIYYGEQALKINKTLNAPVRLINSQAQLGSHWILGGHISEGQELLTAAETLSKQLESSVELASLQIGLASLYRAQGHYREELQALLEADRIMNEFGSPDVSDAASVSSGVPELEDKMESLRIRPASRRTKQPAATTRRTRATTSTRKPTKADATPSKAADTVTESQSLLQIRSDILRQQAACCRSLRDFEKASCLLNNARKYAVSRDSQISVHLGESEHFLAEAIRHFASHAVYCVLPESTISLPSLQSPSKTTGTSKAATKNTARKPRAPARGTRSRAQTASEDFAVMLSKAGDCLNNVFSTATTVGSTLDSHSASRLMSRISMLSHVTAAESTSAWSQPPANVNELGRIGAFTREHTAIDLDKQLAEYNDPLLWPTPSAMTADPEDLCSSKFAEEYIDILPDNWNVLSLSLSADRSEFIVSRLHQGRSPFLLRLPLKRGNSEEEDEQFTFDDGREEMQELIKLANESSHAAKAQTDRQMKKDWWRNREALDRRMETLLQNIENVWFGGFRGIFSPLPHDTTSLARFASSFQTILDKHLPSRQKGGRAEGPRLTLHPNVLELFIGVADLDDQEDPEETLMDLLYFVVDILQFQGERNAYDEIDFDMMVVETLDAVRAYHDAASNRRGKHTPNHTVLVLDKSLHLFPWESLPCLQGFPVCRVPSLECLRDRVLQFQDKRNSDLSRGVGIDRHSGTYILNPTGDLRTTQGTFEKDLSALQGWTGIMQREPSEDEFKRGLETTNLFLYFGHGSGAQYIRGRTVKRLEQCAVAFLMGCSSGTLTEAGEYEPYGTPMNYLHAGSPALVATLWDVTDKDIDRFAQSTFDKWGLFDSGSDGATLDEAVSQSRPACVLKYLNGAAPVIYGVPSVFLE
ncbi:putative separin [Aspergillus nomiae NRRL 13137]|uniref:separase n=1 Tax=Aspergillus nomiae NRRL (strain ATCC 15546 / NRRL 13137 / CBS 260.88 / M93) TaxID=1509407 RepID=A0A0L1JC53_ASPN3|nr:putative separin [Aspergillus nomiae NRRL 13137]KNG88988.1 putative separin [Aspergillus nomiae NRRL 13137]